jgi:nucleotide-binding universal stress UspA family protein
MPALEAILVPIDGSPPSIAALEHALVLAEDSGSMIEVLHVETPDAFEVGSTMALAPEVRRESAIAMDDAVERAQRRLRGRVNWRITKNGDPVRTIVETASEGKHDLIVIGTHGFVGRLHSLLGSVAEAVIRNAPCPVLTVREPGASYQSFAERRHGNESLAEQARHH